LLALPLYEEPFLVAVPADHEWKKRKSIASTDLEKESLLLLGSGHCFRDQVLQACPALNRSSMGGLQKTLESSSLETIRHMVASGMGTTVLPCSATRLPSRVVSLVWRKSFPRPRAIEAVRQAALAANLSCVEKIRPGRR
jgi:LysR family hydrogen peroxide-inducible transcriptional activator